MCIILYAIRVCLPDGNYVERFRILTYAVSVDAFKAEVEAVFVDGRRI